MEAHAHQHDNHEEHEHDSHAHVDHGHDDRDEHDHAHDHSHEQDHSHDHDHDHAEGALGWLRELLPFGHGHSHGEMNMDNALESSERGIWALKVSLVGLGITAALQLAVVMISGSVG